MCPTFAHHLVTVGERKKNFSRQAEKKNQSQMKIFYEIFLASEYFFQIKFVFYHISLFNQRKRC